MKHQIIKLASTVALSLGALASAQATSLSNGDFAFTGINGNTTLGGWSFVTFTDIAAGTRIFFTDTNVLQTTVAAGVFSATAETFWSWTASADVAAGTSVALLGTGVSGAYAAKSGAAGGSANGTVTNHNGATSNISSSGDILYAFQAASYATNYQAADITFLGAASNRTTPYASSDNPFAATGLSGIQVREYRINNSTATRYSQFSAQISTNDTPFSSMAELKTALADNANWTTVSASNTIPVVSDVLAVTAAVPEPQSYALLLAGLAAIGAVARRRRPA
ncbi:PEP-CTERM sorting domain-containing protein [Paucibacter sp. B2R-40]|uniref:PEP-CTERM sorting domain-containing protein n=1 Tax=Paucibacter sp. B2R-40 TaxID=2893554 RepID=UPI0021E4B40F|nr:PEP-CTERM sorting domain-containing protein [Paucibacter sp. B2R-40]MCV2354309.1 PEP-CTERM sorting domain-containing protein [Paucibacter sp. B2R-40]